MKRSTRNPVPDWDNDDWLNDTTPVQEGPRRRYDGWDRDDPDSIFSDLPPQPRKRRRSRTPKWVTGVCIVLVLAMVLVAVSALIPGSRDSEPTVSQRPTAPAISIPDFPDPTIAPTLPDAPTAPPAPTLPAPIAPLSIPTENLFRRQFLSPEEQAGYDLVYECIRNFQPESQKFYLRNHEDVNRIIDYLREDQSDFFWAREFAYTYLEMDDGTYEIAVQPTYLCTKDEAMEQQAFVEQITGPVIQRLTGKSDYEKVLGVYEFLIDYFIYDWNYLGASIYQDLKDGRAVCEGYARCMQYMLSRLDVETILISGVATSELGTESHAWNIVKVDGEYYQVDATWGDPITEDGTQELNHFYFLLPDADMYRDHTPDDTFYPVCKSDAYNYYVHNGLMFSIYEEAYLVDFFRQAILEEGEVTFRCASDDLYNTFMNQLFQQKRMWDIVQSVQGHQIKSYYYKNKDTVRAISVSFSSQPLS